MALNALNLPTRAGVKLTVFDWLKFVIGMLPSIPGLIRNRASVVDPRLSSVGTNAYRYQALLCNSPLMSCVVYRGYQGREEI